MQDIKDASSTARPKPKTAKKKKAIARAKGKANQASSSKGGTNSNSTKKYTEADTMYKPGSFKEERFKFIYETMKEKDIPFKEAAKCWLPSAHRASLLEGLPKTELQRRRFVPAMNPRSKKALKSGPQPV